MDDYDPEAPSIPPQMKKFTVDFTDYPSRIVAFPRNGTETTRLIRHLQTDNILSYKHRFWYQKEDELTKQDMTVIANARTTCIRNNCPVHSTRIIWMFYSVFVLFTLFMFAYVLKYVIHLEKIIDLYFKMQI